MERENAYKTSETLCFWGFSLPWNRNFSKFVFSFAGDDIEILFFQMDVYWVVRGQNSPVDYFNKYPGRFTMLHIKDHREIGQSGMVGYDAIFKNTDTAGVRHIVAEIEKYSCPVEESVKQSLDYLLDAPFVKASYSK